LPASTPHQILAVGGHHKAAVALTNGAQAVLGPHIGDLGTTASRERFVGEVAKLLDLYGAKPELVVHDLHPEYFTTTFAREFGVPTLAVQHHHAHVAAGMLQHGWLGRTALGVAFDGTGYGIDGSIWGGEFLLASVGSFERVGHLRPFPLPGGEAAVREPWRVAVALVEDAGGSDAVEAIAALGIDWPLARQLTRLLSRPHLSPQTTSVGRLFDGIAALVLGLSEAAFEGEPAMRLEAAADRTAKGAFEIIVTKDRPFQLDWRPLVRAVLCELAAGIPPGVISTRFHRGLAQAIVNVAVKYGDLPVVLGGGVFQNALLTELCAEMLSDQLQRVGLPGSIPPNDGGLAAGQLAIAIHFLDKKGV
jgi:hydrogenase maturation protein HypF